MTDSPTSARDQFVRGDFLNDIVGTTSSLSEVMDRVAQVAPTDIPVLILGETGTGKEVIAEALHGVSSRSEGPMLRVNCGAISPQLIDSELFGHEKGSFTGATSGHRGWFERADGGTLLLDEIGELAPSAQVRLLRVLQQGAFQRVGGERDVSVDVRLIAATHRDLHLMVEEGRFRKDLWYRLCVFPIRLPSLRSRREDIPRLADHFARLACERLGAPARTLSAEQIALLDGYDWPGNVRELRSVMERAVILGNGRSLHVAKALGMSRDTHTRPSPPAAEQPGAFATLEEAMIGHIKQALERTRGQIEGDDGAARLLDINPHTLRSRMRKLGIDWAKFRG